MSADTIATRNKVLKERSAKSSALQDRLNKIRAKKRAKLGLPPLEDEGKDEEDSDMQRQSDNPVAQEEEAKSTEVGPSASKIPSLQEQKDKRMRAWDFGKPGVFGTKPETFDELDAQWLKDRRADRLSQFAPPKSLYDK